MFNYSLQASSQSGAPTLMLIDDDPDIRDAMKDVLEDEGYRVITAVNGQDGLNKLKSGAKASLILLDMMMPVMNGQKFLETISSEGKLSLIPVIMVSASASPDQSKGAVDIIRKPMDIPYLLESIARYSKRPKQIH